MAHRTTRIGTALFVTGLVLALAIPPVAADQGSATGANGTRLTVSPRTISNLTGEVMVRVTGEGFSPTENGGVGVYLSFGRRPDGERVGNPAYTDVTVAYDGGAGHGTKWIRPGTPSGPNQARLDRDGTFSVDLAVKARFTAPNGVKHSSASETLGVYAYGAHGTEAQPGGYSQRVFVALTFKAKATPKPTAKPTPKPTPKPTARPATMPRPTPTATATSAAVVDPTSSPTSTPIAFAAASSATPAGPTASARPTPPASTPSASATASAATIDVAPTSGVGPGPAIPLVVGVLVLVVVVARRLVRVVSGQPK